MNAPATAISQEMLRPLGLSLLHFVWEGLALAGALAALLAVTRRAQTRYLVAVGTMALMLAAPVATYIYLSQSHAAAAQGSSLSNIGMTMKTLAAVAAPAASLAAQNPAPSRDLLLWFVEAWFAGVVFLSLRTAGGFFLVGRIRRKDARPVPEALRRTCLEIQKRLGIRRAIEFCESCCLDAPAVIGWVRPVVLLPFAALTGLTPEQLEAVIAHELAHIRRLDGLVNVFQIAVETLLFYHPAVWWVSKRIRHERENCCDDVAISVGGDAVEYARALAQMAESHAAPSFAMAANRGPLAARVARLLGMAASGPGIRSASVAVGFLCLAGALFAGNAFVGVAQNNFGEKGVTAADELSTVAAKPAASSTANAAPNAKSNSVQADQASPTTQAESTPAPQSAAATQSAQNEEQNSGSSYIEGMKEAGLENLTVEQLISLKVQGVTPDYVKQIHALGLQPPVEQIIAMKVQGISPEYVKQMQAAGVSIKMDRLIGMKVRGITPEYVAQMKELGFNPDADKLIGMKVQGVTPDYVKAIRATGLNPSQDEIIGMKVQGITPEYAAQMKALGLQISTDKLIGMKVQGVTPEYTKDMQAAGVNVSTDHLIGMKVQGVTPEYVQQMKALGFAPDSDVLIGMKVQGVSPEYAKAMESSGLGKLTAGEIIGAKVQGVTPEFVQEVRSHGFKDLTLEKIIALKHAGIF